MPFTIPFKSFNGGEVSPDLNARTDQAKYQSGLSNCRNFFVRLEGSASNRSGTGFVCPLIKFSQGPGRHIPFIFNNDQAYQLLIHWTGTETRFLVIKNGLPVFVNQRTIASMTAGTPPVVRVASGHAMADGDLVYISSPESTLDIGNRWFQAQNTQQAPAPGEYLSLWEEAAVDGASYAFAPNLPVLIQMAYSVLLPGVTAAQIPGLRYTQSADVLTFVHDELPPFAVTRLADNSWTCADVVFDPSIAPPNGGQISVAAGTVTLRYRITAVSDDTGEESFPGLMTPLPSAGTISLLGTSSPYRVNVTAHGIVTGDEVKFDFSGYVALIGPLAGVAVQGGTYTVTVLNANQFTLNGSNDNGATGTISSPPLASRTAITNHSAVFPTAINTAILTWTKVPAVSGYNIYRETNGVYSYIGTAVGERFEDLGYTADSLNTPPIALNYFNAIGKYPGAVGYYQQRLILGGPSLSPEELRASRSGAFRNFTRSNPTQADDSIRWIMASGQVNQVRHVADMGKLLVFTQGAVFSTEGDDAGTLTPKAINPRKRADYGIGDIRPLTIGQVAIYVQVSGKVVREMEPNSFGVYATRDLTSFAKHLFETGSIVAMSYAEEPFGIIWAVRSDGVMLGLTYLKEHAVDGWHHHDTGAGDRFLDVSCIPEANESATYVLVSRANCNGKTRTYCERMATRTVQAPSDGKFLDSFMTYEGKIYSAVKTYTLRFNTSFFSPADYSLEATGITPGFTALDIGKSLTFLSFDGTELVCVIVSVNASPNYARVTKTGNVPIPPFALNVSTSPLSLAPQSTIPGLWHLNGRTVNVLGDGEVLGPFVVTNGAVTLPVAVSRSVVGLQIVADLETLEPDNAQGETWADKTKAMAELTLKVRNTLGLSVGLNLSQMQTFKDRWCTPGEYVDGNLYTGKLQIINRASVTADGKVFVRQDQPLPCTVLGIYARLEIGEV